MIANINGSGGTITIYWVDDCYDGTAGSSYIDDDIISDLSKWKHEFWNYLKDLFKHIYPPIKKIYVPPMIRAMYYRRILFNKSGYLPWRIRSKKKSSLPTDT